MPQNTQINTLPGIKQSTPPACIEVGPSVRLYSTREAAAQFCLDVQKFEDGLRELGVPTVEVAGSKYFNLASLTKSLFVALEWSRGKSFKFGEPVDLPPEGSRLRLQYEMYLAALTYTGTSWKDLWQRVQRFADVIRKRRERGRVFKGGGPGG